MCVLISAFKAKAAANERVDKGGRGAEARAWYADLTDYHYFSITFGV
jgi:hypothetical protein